MNRITFLVLLFGVSFHSLSADSAAAQADGSPDLHPYTSLPAGYILEPELYVFPSLPKYGLLVKALPDEVEVKVEAVGRFPDGVADTSKFSEFAVAFGYPKETADKLTSLKI